MPQPTIDIAIIGGGTIGLILCAGLCQNENVKVTLYERARSYRALGAGIAFTGCAVECMQLINPDIIAALRECGSVTTSDTKNEARVYLRWIDGLPVNDVEDALFQRPVYTLDAGKDGFVGCRRDQFLEALAKKIPPHVVRFGKDIRNVTGSGVRGKMRLTFSDNTCAQADAVIGCDGIRSRVREIMVGRLSPAAYPCFAGKVAYRALIPMSQAIDVLGEFKARNTHSHVGPKANIITYPVANGSMINATVFVSQATWPHEKSLVATSTRAELEDIFQDWHTCVRDLIHSFPETMDKWGVFDSYEFPLPHYNKGRIAVAGDAAHASSPHHGAGAGMGVEDALCLKTLVDEIVRTTHAHEMSKEQAIDSAWNVYDSVRRVRSQWLVNSSRRVVDLYHQDEWADPSKRVKALTCFEEVKDRSYKIWNYDVEGMVRETVEQFECKKSVVTEFW